MTMQYISTNLIGSGIQYSIPDYDDLYILAGVTVLATDTNAILSSGTAHDVYVAGNLTAQYTAIRVGNDPLNGQNTLTVLKDGSLLGAGSAGADVYGSDSIVTNYGTISSTDGVALSVNGQSIVIRNYGSITSNYHAITLASPFDGLSKIYNYGSIDGYSSAISGGQYSEYVENRGSIIQSIFLNAGSDTLLNRGTISGDIGMGAGNDLCDMRIGTIEGNIALDAGDDRFIGSAAWAENVDGGADKDVLDFRLLSGATVALDDSFDAAGSAAGDAYSNFEVIYGSSSGNDTLRGNSGANSLLGNGGDDWLDGQASSDTLRGGAGVDTLIGGAGSDTFQFTKVEEFGDLVLDFSSNASGNNDRFLFTASAMGGGLVAGALDPLAFQSRTDNVAQDADDRFIFRTTDKTLWFDVDGNGTAAAVMVADLQASATMTSLDIVLI